LYTHSFTRFTHKEEGKEGRREGEKERRREGEKKGRREGRKTS
jgi:hypothetical protein